jgi:hypothetical protein
LRAPRPRSQLIGSTHRMMTEVREHPPLIQRLVGPLPLRNSSCVQPLRIRSAARGHAVEVEAVWCWARKSMKSRRSPLRRQDLIRDHAAAKSARVLHRNRFQNRWLVLFGCMCCRSATYPPYQSMRFFLVLTKSSSSVKFDSWHLRHTSPTKGPCYQTPAVAFPFRLGFPFRPPQLVASSGSPQRGPRRAGQGQAADVYKGRPASPAFHTLS